MQRRTSSPPTTRECEICAGEEVETLFQHIYKTYFFSALSGEGGGWVNAVAANHLQNGTFLCWMYRPWTILSKRLPNQTSSSCLCTDFIFYRKYIYTEIILLKEIYITEFTYTALHVQLLLINRFKNNYSSMELEIWRVLRFIIYLKIKNLMSLIIRALLINKILEDGNTLFRWARILFRYFYNCVVLICDLKTGGFPCKSGLHLCRKPTGDMRGRKGIFVFDDLLLVSSQH
jgi:hypothetical protein